MPLLGRMMRRALAQPGREDKSEPALFRVSHEDGDEEDLEAHEVQRCLIDPVGKVI